MDYSNLNDQEIKALLMQYDSEMRKLSFQMQIIQSTIQKLHESLNASDAEKKAPAVVLNTEKASETKETPVVPKVITGVEYPKKRAPKINLEEKTVEVKELKKRGPKPKAKAEKVLAEPKKRGRKPKTAAVESVKTETVTAEPKKRGPKPKAKVETVVETTVAEPKKRGPKPKAKVEAPVKEPKKRGPKAKADKPEPKKRGPKAKVKEEKGKRKYTKENPWPEFITATLAKYNHVLSSAQLYEMADEENKIKGYNMSDKDVKAMVSRAFHQLSNNKKSIKKFDIKGSKSYNYALVNWLDAKGEVKAEFQA